jgi:diguanylate cyclase (GGDEF)-like protein
VSDSETPQDNNSAPEHAVDPAAPAPVAPQASDPPPPAAYSTPPAGIHTGGPAAEAQPPATIPSPPAFEAAAPQPPAAIPQPTPIPVPVQPAFEPPTAAPQPPPVPVPVQPAFEPPTAAPQQPPALAPAQPAYEPPAAAPSQQATDQAGPPAPSQPPPPSSAAALRRRVPAGKLVWATVALVCVALGVIASLIGAHRVARNDAVKARQSSQQSTAAAAGAAKLALQREEELRISGATYLAGNPKATPAEFYRWAKWAQTLRRNPELEQLGLVALVRAPELASFVAPPVRKTTAPPVRKTTAPAASSPVAPSTTAAAATPSTAGTTTGVKAHPTAVKPVTRPARHLKLTPPGARPYYCLALARLSRHPHESPPAGYDYCAERSGLLRTRDTGLGHYTAQSAANTGLIEAMTPVYIGNQPPATTFARQAAFVGWLRQLFSPGVVVSEALQGHPGVALRLSFRNHSANAAFQGSAVRSGGASTKLELHNGWTVQGYGAPVSTGVLSDGDALALLIVGCVLSALFGLLIFLLGDGRSPAPVSAQGPLEPDAPTGDLYDRLTRLPNRALMLDRAECMLARAGRQSGLLVGALFIDLDWFEDLNERLGRTTGDRILKIVAERLEGVVRTGDTVGRLGGDEFVLLVESAARGARLDSLARRVVEALHKPLDLDGQAPDVFLTASIGVAFGRYASAEDLLRDAQLAVQAAKSAGKDRYTLFNANMRSVIEGRGVLEVELNAALADKQFFVLYEPIFDLATGQVAGLEALVRWLHPKQGVLMPTDFIPLAEETGLTVPIGRWVLEEACGRAAAWNVAGHPIGLTVEVSANQLNRDGFVTDVRRALQQSGIEAPMLTLAIPETTVMRDVGAAAERLQEIKQLGVRIAIDDFGGSGYAYHSDLRLLPLDFLKVDRSSLAAAEDEDYRTWLLEAIMIVGRDLSLMVVAKGIESFEQVNALQAMGCTMVQGALTGKPVPASAINSVFSVTLPTVRAAT